MTRKYIAAMAERSPVDLEGVARDAAEQREAAERSESQTVNDVRTVLGTVEGRRFVWSLMERAGVFRTSLGTTDALTNFNEGRRDQGLWVLDRIMSASPDSFVTMLKENQNA